VLLCASIQTQAIELTGGLPTLADHDLTKEGKCLKEILDIASHSSRLSTSTIDTLLITNNPCTVLVVVKEFK